MKINDVQKQALMECVKKNPKLISGKFSATFTYKNAEEMWKEVAQILNSIPGARKDWKNWRKTWHDMRSRTKTKISMNRKSMGRTGGGPPEDEPLSKTEEDILAIIKVVSIDGHNAPESAVEFDMSDVYKVDADTDQCESAQREELAYPKPSVTTVTEPIPSTSTWNTNTESVKRPLPPSMNTTDKIAARKIPKRKSSNVSRTSEAVQSYKEELKKKNAIKEKYYQEKVSILKEMVVQKARTAAALERIADSIDNLI